MPVLDRNMSSFPDTSSQMWSFDVDAFTKLGDSGSQFVQLGSK